MAELESIASILVVVEILVASTTTESTSTSERTTWKCLCESFGIHQLICRLPSRYHPGYFGKVPVLKSSGIELGFAKALFAVCIVMKW